MIYLDNRFKIFEAKIGRTEEKDKNSILLMMSIPLYQLLLECVDRKSARMRVLREGGYEDERVEGPKASLFKGIWLDNTHISINKKRLKSKDCQRNPKTKCTEEATLKKVRRVKICFMSETDRSCLVWGES